MDQLSDTMLLFPLKYDESFCYIWERMEALPKGIGVEIGLNIIDK